MSTHTQIIEVAHLHPESESLLAIEDAIDDCGSPTDATGRIALIKARWDYEDEIIRMYREVIFNCLNNQTCAPEDRVAWADECLDELESIELDTVIRTQIFGGNTPKSVER